MNALEGMKEYIQVHCPDDEEVGQVLRAIAEALDTEDHAASNANLVKVGKFMVAAFG